MDEKRHPGAGGEQEKKIRLLLVEDEDDDAVLVCAAFRRSGYSVFFARVETPEAVRQALRAQAWDAVIADHNLPAMSSLEALALVHESGLDLPFVVVSGSMDEEFAASVMRYGAHDFINKAQLARLVPAVERELRDCAARRARRWAEVELEHRSRHDPFTGLLNRREIVRRLDEAIDTGDQACFVSLDIDGFRIINQTCGHAAGDAFLREATGCLVAVVPIDAAFARLGADELGILLYGSSVEEGRLFAAELLEAMSTVDFRWMDHSFELRASIGVCPLNRGDAEAVLAAADAACAAAKQQGGHRVRVYSEDDAQLVQHHGEMVWVSEILRALRDDRFQLHYQEIVPLQAKANGGHREILLRLRDEQGGMVSPGQFIPPAERFHLISNIDRRVVDGVLRHLRDAEDESTYFVNISGDSLSDPAFLEDLLEMCRSQVPQTNRLGFEITETSAIRELDATIGFMRSLRELGCRFALDDFGSGLSSFVYLRRLPVDFLKIEGSFVREYPSDALAGAIVDSLNRIAHTVGLETIAECVETESVAEQMRAIGVEHAQGWAFHRPEPLV